MRLLVLGANGQTGRIVVRQALERSAQVSAVVRTEAKKPAFQHDNLKTYIGDPCNVGFLKSILTGQDALISTLGGRSPGKAATSVYPASACAIVEATRDIPDLRVLLTSSALLFPSKRWRDVLLKRCVPKVVSNAALMESIIGGSDLQWTVARPGFLTNNADITYRAAIDALPENGTSVSRAGLARFLLDAIEREEYFGKAIGVSKAQLA
ncbi:MAG: NAD(P)H-binding protein [Pseudomonadota bacterium]